MNWRARHARKRDVADLNITAFMNLMVILVPFLLITAVFSRMAILELNLPTSSSAENEEPPIGLGLEIIVRRDAIEVNDRNSGRLKLLRNDAEGYDLDGLGDYLKRVKRRFPDKLDATLLLEPQISYDTVVQVMDTMRVVTVVQAATVVKAELFPEISIGDAPLTGS